MSEVAVEGIVGMSEATASGRAAASSSAVPQTITRVTRSCCSGVWTRLHDVQVSG